MTNGCALECGVGCCFIGWTGGDSVALDSRERRSLSEVTLADLRAAHEGFLPKLMGGELAPAV